MEITIATKIINANSPPILVQPAPQSLELKKNTVTEEIVRIATPNQLHSGATNFTPSTQVVCPFALNGCHKKGDKIDVKRHVRDDRNLHLVLLAQSLIPIRNNILRQQSDYIDQCVELASVLEIAEAVYHKFGCQFVFRVPNIGMAVVKASKSKSSRKLFSQPFYSHGFGYKLMAIVSPYGDGIALREFLSVFVCIMKSDFDEILDWPFQFKITFTLLSQDLQTQASKTYDPEEHPEAKLLYKKPIGLRNGAFGFQDFLPLDQVNSFSQSGDFFLKINVHLDQKQLHKTAEIGSEMCQGIEINRTKI